MINWVEQACADLHVRGILAPDLPPCLIPYIQPGDEDWHPRMELFNRPGDYHNGGIWPFICSFYISALVYSGQVDLARQKLAALDDLIELPREPTLQFGFNEWYSAQDGLPRGQDWQTWSAAMYIYAAACVEKEFALFFQDSPQHLG
jgi:glycogen debranching enzyme